MGFNSLSSPAALLMGIGALSASDLLARVYLMVVSNLKNRRPIR